MILTGSEIAKKVRSGEIIIEPFDEARLNPNSYNYQLGTQYCRAADSDSSKPTSANRELLSIPGSGLTLAPGILYLASTLETIGSMSFVTSLIGRSSVGRLGLFVQVSADLGNLGPAHCWTLELTSVQPVKIYPEMTLGQVSFWTPSGAIRPYDGPYTNYSVPVSNLRSLGASES